MENSQGILILGASQRHIRMIPFKCYSETVVYVVSDGTFPGNYWMGEGWGSGVWDENVQMQVDGHMVFADALALP